MDRLQWRNLELPRTTQKLFPKGPPFSTLGDTEVIGHAYEEWQEDCVNHPRGIFAFYVAYFDTKTVFIARDPFGIKPLYYLKTDDYFI